MKICLFLFSFFLFFAFQRNYLFKIHVRHEALAPSPQEVTHIPPQLPCVWEDVTPACHAAETWAGRHKIPGAPHPAVVARGQVTPPLGMASGTSASCSQHSNPSHAQPRTALRSGPGSPLELVPSFPHPHFVSREARSSGRFFNSRPSCDAS